ATRCADRRSLSTVRPSGTPSPSRPRGSTRVRRKRRSCRTGAASWRSSPRTERTTRSRPRPSRAPRSEGNVGWKANLAGVVLRSAVACDMPTSKVAQGQLYLSGEQRFDAYFRDVHAIQVWAAQWPEDKRQTRKPLVSILDLTPDAADVTIIQATHEKISY